MRTAPLAILIPLLVAACAPNAEIPGARTDRAVVTVQTSPGEAGQQLELTRRANINSVALQVGVAEAWAALPPIFEALGLPITAADRNAHALSSVQRLRRIGDKSVSSYFRCPGPYGNLASSGDVYVSIQSQILPGDGGTGSTLRTQVDATARASTGGNQVQCSSTGSVQQVIADALTKRLENL